MATKEKKNQSPKADDLRYFYDLTSRLELIADHVFARGLKGSRVVKAFALAQMLYRRDPEKPNDVANAWKIAREAWVEWVKLPLAERKAILGGWHSDPVFPTPREQLEIMAGYGDNEVLWQLSIVEMPDHVSFWSDYNLTHSIADVQLFIRQGTRKAEALRQLRNIMAALEARWHEAIALDGHNRVDHPLQEPKPRQPEPGAEGILPPGTFVRDNSLDKSGIILGGFRSGKNTLYTYICADGTLESQYAMGLKVADAAAGGLPAVADINGADPLAEMRTRRGNTHADLER
jgi:hypothetical protein